MSTLKTIGVGLTFATPDGLVTADLRYSRIDGCFTLSAPIPVLVGILSPEAYLSISPVEDELISPTEISFSKETRNRIFTWETVDPIDFYLHEEHQ